MGPDVSEIGKSEKRPSFLPQYLIVLAASLSFFTRGLHTAWPSPSLPLLLNMTENFTDILGNAIDPHHFSITTEEASWVVVIYSMSICIGGPVSAYLIHLIGRKQTILLSAIPHLASFILIYLAPSLEVLLVARFLAGLSEGLANLALPIYVGEIADSKIRGKLGCCTSIMIIMGLLMVNIIGSFVSIVNAALVCCIFPLTLLLSWAWLPESPYYLLMKEEGEEAKKALIQLRGTKDIAKELGEISRAVDKQMCISSTFKDLFTIRCNRRALVIALMMEFIQQASGISAIQSYTQIIFIESKQDMSHQMSACLLMSVQLLFSIVGANLVDRLGRKPLLVVSCCGCGIALLLEGLYFYLQSTDSEYLDDLKWLPLAALILFIAVYSIGLAIVLNVLVGEIFAVNVKGKAVGMIGMWYGILVFIISRFFQVLIDMVGLHLPFWLYAVNCFVGSLYIFYFVPETKGKTLDEIQDWFKS